MGRPFQRGAFDELPVTPRIPHPYFESEALEVTVDSRPFGKVRLHVRRHGSGPPLLLVHGLMTSSYSWRYVLEPLGRRYTVFAPDLPGSGRSDACPDRSHSAPALGELIGELQSALGIAGCRAIGNSMGGYLCMQRALDAPDSFERLVVIHAPAFPEPRVRLLGAALAIPGSAGVLRWMIGRSPQRWVHRNVHYHDESLKSVEEAREYGAPLSTPEGVEAFRRYLAETMDARGLAEFTGRLARARFPVPLLLVYSRQDPMVPPRIGTRLHELVSRHAGDTTKLEWLEDSSHFAHVDSPDRTLALVEPFLGERGDAAA